MKTFPLLILFVLLAGAVHAQLGVSLNTGSLSFAEVNYEWNRRILVGVRMDTEAYLESAGPEAIAAYVIRAQPWADAYVGLGYKTQSLNGPLIPMGLNVYPFDYPQLGLSMELAVLYPEALVLRSTIGLRYRFIKQKDNN